MEEFKNKGSPVSLTYLFLNKQQFIAVNIIF